MEEKEKSSAFEWIRAFVVAIVLAFVIRTFFYAPILVDGVSMMPTLHDQNRMIVDKISYVFTEPDRFDIVVFKATETEDYIKRIIGLPGDSVEYKDDVLYVNGKPYEEPYLDEYKSALNEGELLTYNFKMEELTGEKVVPEGYLFVMGDNRPQSNDSRAIGMVSMDDVVGKTSIVYWPFKEVRIEKYQAPETTK